MKWFVLLVHSLTGDVAMEVFFGDTACERARVEYVEIGVPMTQTKCTPRRIK